MESTLALNPTMGDMLISERKVGNFNVNSITMAPLQVEVKFFVKADPSAVFKLMTLDFLDWFDGIDSVDWDHSNSVNGTSVGKNSFRVCQMGKKKLCENINYYDEPSVFSYSIDPEKSSMSFPTTDHCGVIVVESDNSGGSLVTWCQFYKKKFHPMSLFINTMMKNMMIKKNLKNLFAKHEGGFID